jgi:signal peptide peptidase SppA
MFARMKYWIFCCLLMGLVFNSCSITGKIMPSAAKNSDSLNSTLQIMEKVPEYKAVVIKLDGPVSEKWVTVSRPFFEDTTLNALILWIESPGGTVTDTKIVAHELEFLKTKHHKHLFIYTEQLLASGAYWVSCVANEIIAAPSAEVGSIGVYVVRIDAQRYYESMGIKIYYIASDSNKILGNDASELTASERAHWEKIIQDLHYQFMSFVWNHRAQVLINAYIYRAGLGTKTQWTEEELTNVQTQTQLEFRAIADGSVYDNEHAYLYGLIDRYMYFDELVQLLNSLHYTVYNVSGYKIVDFYVEPLFPSKVK